MHRKLRKKALLLSSEEEAEQLKQKKRRIIKMKRRRRKIRENEYEDETKDNSFRAKLVSHMDKYKERRTIFSL